MVRNHYYCSGSVNRIKQFLSRSVFIISVEEIELYIRLCVNDYNNVISITRNRISAHSWPNLIEPRILLLVLMRINYVPRENIKSNICRSFFFLIFSYIPTNNITGHTILYNHIVTAFQSLAPIFLLLSMNIQTKYDFYFHYLLFTK